MPENGNPTYFTVEEEAFNRLVDWRNTVTPYASDAKFNEDVQLLLAECEGWRQAAAVLNQRGYEFQQAVREATDKFTNSCKFWETAKRQPPPPDQGDAQILAALLRWLCNHYELNTQDKEVRERVVARIERVLKVYPVTGEA